MAWGRGLGLVPIADPASFAWAGPWIARVGAGVGQRSAAVVMYGVPSGLVWDPAGVTDSDGWKIEDGFLVAALDVALGHQGRDGAASGGPAGRMAGQS